MVMAGDGPLGAAILIFSAIVWMWLPEDARAQTTTTTTTFNASNVTKVCHTKCCGSFALKTEARLACQEFRKWGIQDSACVLWQLNAARFCTESCSNCTEMGRAIYDQCLFFLQSQMPYMEAMEYCRIVAHDFEHNGRCNSVCNVTVDDCFKPAGKQCMRECGNFQNCECYQWRGIPGEPDICMGKTLLRGYIPGIKPPKKYECRQIGEQCKNHRPGERCGKYKWCTKNMCLVKNVTCPIVDSCQKYGACETTTGKCYYTYRDDGVPCDDNTFYTHDDTCEGGKCIGWVDRCLRDDVQCGTTNPCLWPNGTCHPRTGACVFVKQPNGKACASAPNVSLDGTCQDGVCRRIVTDLCANSNCSNSSLAGYCFHDPTCDPLTGQCIVEQRVEGMWCNDGDEETFKDICIEGKCVGDKHQFPMFKKVGHGFCADAQGRMLQRYFADTFDEAGCQDQCTRDPGCVAYSYGFHFCSIYGGGRAQHPKHYSWRTAWRLGNLWGDAGSPSQEVVKVVKPAPGEQVMVCMRKVPEYTPPEVIVPIGHEIAFGCLLFMIVCTPGFWLILWKLRQHKEGDDDDESSEGEAHEDPTAGENLQIWEDGGGMLAIPDIGAKGQELPTLDNGPPLSPREGGVSSVAMAPESLEDNDVSAAEGKALEDNVVEAPLLIDDGVLDPRGQVAEEADAVKTAG